MKTAGHMLRVLLVSSLLAGCSDDGGSSPDGTTVDSGPDGSAAGQVGDPCEKDDECDSAICYEKTCKKPCTGPTDCDSGDDCTSDDGVRTFCNTPTYLEAVGQSCAITEKCPDASMKCLGGKDYAGAYCTAECRTDADCPAEFFCRELSDKKTYCYRRDFCAHCFFDAQCGPDSVCVKGHCSYACTPGKTDCPRYAECKNVDGQDVCMHQSGSCVGDGKLCTPCITKDDCQDKALCLTFTYTQESFCSEECGSSTCPSNFDCVEISTSATEKTKQCAPHVDQGSEELPKCVGTLNPIGEVGATLRDFAMVGYSDSDGDGSLENEQLSIIKLSDFKARSKVILFNISAGWCGPCQNETKDFEYLMQTYGPQGLMIFQVLFDSDQQGVEPTVALLDAWVQVLDPAGAVGIDPARESVVLNTNGTTPLNIIVDAKTLEVLDKVNGYSLTTTEDKLKTFLGIASP